MSAQLALSAQSAMHAASAAVCSPSTVQGASATLQRVACASSRAQAARAGAGSQLALSGETNAARKPSVRSVASPCMPCPELIAVYEDSSRRTLGGAK